MKVTKVTFTRQQKAILAACITIYTAAYCCRLNLSAALSSVMAELSLSMARGGMLQTAFAAVYALGQLMNGTIVDRVNPARYMLLGIAGTAACNLLMGACASFPMMLGVWALNAVFQSMMWTPIMRILALYFTDTAARERANAAVALTLIAGHFCAWAIAGFLAARVSWRLSFAVPACIALGAGLLGARVLFHLNVEAQQRQASARQMHREGETTLSVFAHTGFFLVLGTCVLYGFIRDGVVTWAPTILSRIAGGAVSSTAFTLILPAINIFGVALGFALRFRGAKPHGVVVMMMAVSMLCGAALLGTSAMLLTAVLLGCICAGMYGANTMLTGLIPLEYDRVGRTGMTAGMIDSLIYAGSALAGVFGGSIYETLGADMLYGAWIAAAAVSAVLMALAGRMSAEYWGRGQ